MGPRVTRFIPMLRDGWSRRNCDSSHQILSLVFVLFIVNYCSLRNQETSNHIANVFYISIVVDLLLQYIISRTYSFGCM